MNALLFLIGNLAALGLASALPDLLIPRREPWRRVLLGFAAYLLSIQAAVLGLGLAGKLTAGWAVAAVAAMAALPLGLAARARQGKGAAENQRAGPPPEARGGDPLLAIPIFVFGGFGGFLALQLLFGATNFHWDDLSYHASAMAHWMKDERLSLSPYWYQAYFPLNSEAFALWFMLPWRADAYLSLAGFFWAAFALAAVVSLGLAMRRSWMGVLLPAALLVAAPMFAKTARTACAVDVAAPALWLAALAFLAEGTEAWTLRERIVDAAASGLLAGFATGAKTSFAIVPVILLFLWIFVGSRGAGAKSRAGLLTAFFIGACATGGFWYLRTTLITGNPLFPAEIGPFEGPFTSEAQAKTKLVHFLMFPENLRVILREHLDWPYGLGAIAGLGLLAGLFRFRAGQARTADESRLSLALVVSGAAFIALYPFLPFSGATHDLDSGLRIRLRFVLLPFAIGLLLAGGLAEPGRKWRGLFAGLALLAALSALKGSPAQIAARCALGLGAVILAGVFAGGFAPLPAGSKPRWALAGAGLLTLAVLAPFKQRATDQWLFAYLDAARPIGKAWKAADSLPAGSRIAFFYWSRTMQYYPLFGRKFELAPVRVDASGRASKPEHEAWREEGYLWWGDEMVQPGSPTAVIENLIDARIDYVLTTRDGLPAWPPQHEILRDSGSAAAVYDDGHAVIWKLLRPEERALPPPAD